MYGRSENGEEGVRGAGRGDQVEDARPRSTSPSTVPRTPCSLRTRRTGVARHASHCRRVNLHEYNNKYV